MFYDRFKILCQPILSILLPNTILKLDYFNKFILLFIT